MIFTEDFDPRYAVHDFENNTSPSKWLAKKRTLEAVYKSLLRYIQNHTNLDPTALGGPVDLNAIAEHDDEHQTVKVATQRRATQLDADLTDFCFQLLKIFLAAAVSGHKNIEYIGNITNKLDEVDQAEIAEIIKEVSQRNISCSHPADMIKQITKGIPYETVPNVTDTSLPLKLTKDLELALEADYAILAADYEALKKKHADFITRFERLQQSHEDLLAHSADADHELESLRGSNDNDPTHFISNLKNQIREQDDLIATQEQQIESDRIIKEKQQRELVSLRPAAERLVTLEDEVKELRTENATLSKKSNMVDHYTKKLAQQSGIEKDNATLRQRVYTLEENQIEFDKVHDENAKLQTTIGEYVKRFDTYENEHVELTNQKKLLEEELRIRDAQVQSLQARQQHDEKFIDSLHEQIRTNTAGPPSSPDSPITRPVGLSLGEELEQSEEPSYALQISRLRAENQLLKSNTAGTANATLRIDLEESERIRKRLEENLRDLTEKHAIGQMQLNSMLNNYSGEKLVPAMDRLLSIGPLQILTDDYHRNEAVMATRKLYLEANKENSGLKSKLAEIQAELSSRDRELLAARADRKFILFLSKNIEANQIIVSAIDREEMEALEDLKATNEIITSSFQNDLLILQSKHKALTTDHEQQKTQLIDALLSKDRLMKDLASFKERSGTNGDDAYQKAQSKLIIEEEKAQKALQEVRKETDAGDPKSSGKARKLLKVLSRLSFNPYSSKTRAVGPESTPESDQATLDHLEFALQRERSAIGSLPPVPEPLISPRIIPLPASPARPHFERTEIRRHYNRKAFNHN